MKPKEKSHHMHQLIPFYGKIIYPHTKSEINSCKHDFVHGSFFRFVVKFMIPNDFNGTNFNTTVKIE